MNPPTPSDHVSAYGRYFSPEVETASRETLDALQEHRLLALLPFAYAHGALVRETWDRAGVHPAAIRSIADFKAMAPFLDKDDLRRYRDKTGDPFGGVLTAPRADLNVIGSSSGTTGDPTFFSHAWRAPSGGPAGPGLNGWRPSPFFGATPRDFWEMGARPGDHSVLFGMRWRGPVLVGLQAIGTTPICLGYTPDDFRRFIALSLKLRPTLIYPLSTPVVLGLSALETAGKIEMRDVFSSYRGVIFAGEPIGPRIQAILDRWGVGDRAYRQTSLGDVTIAHDCQERAGCHAWEDMVLPEFIDPETGMQAAGDTGRAELVVTALVNDVDPLIRFRSGDLVEFDRRPCRCGRLHVRYVTLGRAGDEVRLHGRSIIPLDIWPHVEKTPETAAGLFQILRPQRDIDVLRLRVGFAGTHADESLLVRVADAVEHGLGVRPEVELVPDAELLRQGPPHKIPRTAKA